MAAEPLRDDLIQAGETLLAILDKLGLSPEAAAWIHYHALGDWRYYVASGLVDTVGRRKVYRLLLDAFEVIEMPEELSVFDVHLESPRGPIFQSIKTVIRAGEQVRVRFEDCFVNGDKFDAFLYRFNPIRKKVADRKQMRAFEAGVKRVVENEAPLNGRG